MRKALSLDLRERVVRAYRGGDRTQQEVADQFGIGTATLRRWLRREEAGKLAHDPNYSHGPRPMIEVANLAVLEELLAEQSDATNVELSARMAERTGLAVSPATISRAIAVLGWTRKKVPRRQRARHLAYPRSSSEVAGVAGERRSCPARVHRRERFHHQHDPDPRESATRNTNVGGRAQEPRLGHHHPRRPHHERAGGNDDDRGGNRRRRILRLPR